jgi:hypothetical protein
MGASPGTVGGAAVTAPGVGTTTEPRTIAAVSAGGASPSPTGGSSLLSAETAAQRPEILLAAAFAAAFLFGRLLRRIVD